jgi:hypothetical protein
MGPRTHFRLDPGGGLDTCRKAHTGTAPVGKNELDPGRILDKSAAPARAQMCSHGNCAQIRPTWATPHGLAIPFIRPPNTTHGMGAFALTHITYASKSGRATGSLPGKVIAVHRRWAGFSWT